VVKVMNLFIVIKADLTVSPDPLALQPITSCYGMDYDPLKTNIEVLKPSALRR
jgi:hypothetical protein